MIDRPPLLPFEKEATAALALLTTTFHAHHSGETFQRVLLASFSKLAQTFGRVWLHASRENRLRHFDPFGTELFVKRGRVNHAFPGAFNNQPPAISKDNSRVLLNAGC